MVYLVKPMIRLLGYENSIQSFYINTSFEQYKDVNLFLGLAASYDDLQANSTASEILKNKQELLVSYQASMDFHLILETECLTQRKVQFLE